MQNIAMTDLSDTELDAVGAGWGHFTQVSGFNTAVGIQVAPTVNISLFSAGVIQFGATQNQFVNAGNIG